MCVLTAFEKTDSSNWSMVLPGLFVLHVVLPVQHCLLWGNISFSICVKYVQAQNPSNIHFKSYCFEEEKDLQILQLWWVRTRLVGISNNIPPSQSCVWIVWMCLDWQWQVIVLLGQSVLLRLYWVTSDDLLNRSVLLRLYSVTSDGWLSQPVLLKLYSVTSGG